ncbi:hypothetical protein F8388_001462 [Cannabis sativa]|uniref:Uncharacterized protein n=2 Tax=Cannabis sativa TaxID=3483 RepID=A0A7J6GMT8_CANSA|nr:hypothetical protein G4B88_011664 [Cannabis sativa]KAF4384224.1 hypothetical protein F8388_001462 [Cannabis sativa]
MAKFNVIQKKKRAQIAERKRAIHGDPSSRKLKVKPQNQSVSRKRKHCTVIPETPMSDIAILKCSSGKASFDFHAKVSDQNNKFSEVFTVIPDTPMSDIAIAKCSRVSSIPKTTVSSLEYKFSGRLYLVLTNGIEVKLQRNAFSVIEAPTGNEEDDDFDFDSIPWHGSDLSESCTLLVKRKT